MENLDRMTDLEKLNDINYLKTITCLTDKERFFLRGKIISRKEKSHFIKWDGTIKSLEENFLNFINDLKFLYKEEFKLIHINSMSANNYIHFVCEIPYSDEELIEKYQNILLRNKKYDLQGLFAKKIEKADTDELEIIENKLKK